MTIAADGLLAHSPEDRKLSLYVGSVEYLNAAMEAIGLSTRPADLSYPPNLKQFLRRDVALCALSDLPSRRLFVKPATTKLFNGFIIEGEQPDFQYDDHDQEQIDVILNLPPTTTVWYSNPIDIVAEWRAYVLHGEVLGIARYDPGGPESVPAPPTAWWSAIVDALHRAPAAPCAYAIDTCLMASGEYALVEVNDAFALGLYSNAITPRQYLKLLWERWIQIVELHR